MSLFFVILISVIAGYALGTYFTIERYLQREREEKERRQYENP